MMPLNRARRATLASLVSIAALGATAAVAQSADAYPEEQVRLVIPFSPGGGTDVIFRLVAQELEQDLDTPWWS